MSVGSYTSLTHTPATAAQDWEFLFPHHPVVGDGCISSRAPRPALASGNILQLHGVLRTCATTFSCLPPRSCFLLRRPVRPPPRQPLAHSPRRRSPLPGPTISVLARP